MAHGGDGGCTAVALTTLGVWPLVAAAAAALDAQIAPLHQKWLSVRGPCDEAWATHGRSLGGAWAEHGRSMGGAWAERGPSVGGAWAEGMYSTPTCLLYAHVPAVCRPLLHRASVCCVCGGRGRAQRHGWPGWRPGRRRTRECVAGVRTVCVSPKSIGRPERFFCPFFRAPPVSNRRAPFQTTRRPFQTGAPFQTAHRPFQDAGGPTQFSPSHSPDPTNTDLCRLMTAKRLRSANAESNWILRICKVIAWNPPG